MLGTELPALAILHVVQTLFTEIVWGRAACGDFVYNWDDKHFIWMWYLQVYLYKKNSGWENEEWMRFLNVIFILQLSGASYALFVFPLVFSM